MATSACIDLTWSAGRPSLAIASPAVPMMADWVSAPPARPAASPLFRWNSFAQTITVTSAETARNTAMAISRSELRFSELKKPGPESYPTA